MGLRQKVGLVRGRRSWVFMLKIQQTPNAGIDRRGADIHNLRRRKNVDKHAIPASGRMTYRCMRVIFAVIATAKMGHAGWV
jgi:hypothetical protein